MTAKTPYPPSSSSSPKTSAWHGTCIHERAGMVCATHTRTRVGAHAHGCTPAHTRTHAHARLYTLAHNVQRTHARARTRSKLRARHESCYAQAGGGVWRRARTHARTFLFIRDKKRHFDKKRHHCQNNNCHSPGVPLTISRGYSWHRGCIISRHHRNELT